MTSSSDRLTDTPAHYKTAQRPGQSGEETERRAGPSPRSAHPTGPSAPYEPTDPEGLAAEKHRVEPAVEPARPGQGEGGLSETITIIDTRKAAGHST